MASSVTIISYIILTCNRDTLNELLLHRLMQNCSNRKIVESKVDLGIVKWSNLA